MTTGCSESLRASKRRPYLNDVKKVYQRSHTSFSLAMDFCYRDFFIHERSMEMTSISKAEISYALCSCIVFAQLTRH